MRNRIVDLSMTIENNLTAQRPFSGNVNAALVSHTDSLAFGAGTAEDRFTSAWNYLSMTEHCGTHVDAFYHMKPDGQSVEEMPLQLFFGKAVCLDIRHIPERGTVGIGDVEAAEEKSGVRIDGHIVLFATGLHRKYYPGDEVLHRNVEISPEVVRWLHQRGSRMHGVEGPSTDILDKNTFPSHRACRDLGVSHYEWLVNLEELVGQGEFMFYGIPLRIRRGSGSPVRAMAVINEEEPPQGDGEDGR